MVFFIKEKMKEERESALTILPRLNSLNQEPEISLGHEDILTLKTTQRKMWIKHNGKRPAVRIVLNEEQIYFSRKLNKIKPSYFSYSICSNNWNEMKNHLTDMYSFV